MTNNSSISCAKANGFNQYHEFLKEELSNYFLVVGSDLNERDNQFLTFFIEDVLKQFYFSKEQIKQSCSPLQFNGVFSFYVDGDYKEFKSRLAYTRFVFTESKFVHNAYEQVKGDDVLCQIVTNLLNIAWLRIFLFLEHTEKRTEAELENF